MMRACIVSVVNYCVPGGLHDSSSKIAAICTYSAVDLKHPHPHPRPPTDTNVCAAEVGQDRAGHDPYAPGHGAPSRGRGVAVGPRRVQRLLSPVVWPPGRESLDTLDDHDLYSAHKTGSLMPADSHLQQICNVTVIYTLCDAYEVGKDERRCGSSFPTVCM